MGIENLPSYRYQQKPKKKVSLVLAFGILTIFIISILSIAFIKETVANKNKPYSDFLDKELLKDYPNCDFKLSDPSTWFNHRTGVEGLPTKMFCQLPEKPKDFERWKIIYQHGKVSDLSNIPTNVWAQPDVSPNWNGQILRLLQNPDPNRIGAGYAPQIDYADVGTTVSPGDETEVNFIVRNIATTIFWIGIKLEPVYPKMGSIDYQDIHIKTIQDPKTAEECFDINITPQEFALAPSFPVFVWDDKNQAYYARMINVKIKAKPDCPKGHYVLGINPTTPSQEFSEEYMLKEYKGSRLLNKYSPIGGSKSNVGAFIGIDRPFFRCFITVE